MRGGSNVEPPLSRTRETATRFTARRHAVFRLSEITGRTHALGSGSWIRIKARPEAALDDPGMGAFDHAGQSPTPRAFTSRPVRSRGFEPLPHGVRNRHASATLRAYESVWGRDPRRVDHLGPGPKCRGWGPVEFTSTGAGENPPTTEFEPLPHGVRNRHASATLRACESVWGRAPRRVDHLGLGPQMSGGPVEFSSTGV